MLRYETLMLSIPEITNDETKSLEKVFDGIVQKHKGATVSFERWGKYRLAYPIRNNDYGVYFLARYEVSPEHHQALISELDELLRIKINNLIMRALNTSLDAKASLEYKKPPSLDESPKDVKEFLKKNKMGSLLEKEPRAAATTSASEQVASADDSPEAEAVVADSLDESTTQQSETEVVEQELEEQEG